MSALTASSGVEDLKAIESVPLDQRDIAFTTYELLVRAAQQWPDRPAAIVVPDVSSYTDSFTWTFADLRHEVEQIANVLSHIGVGRNDPVTVMSPNSSTVITATLAAQAVGIVAPVNPAFSVDRLKNLMGVTGSHVMIAAGPDLDPAVWMRLVDSAAELGVTHLLALRPDGPLAKRTPLDRVGGVQVEYLDDLIGQVESRPVTPPRPGDIAAYFHTGGTTGFPKIAAHTHANEATTAWGIATAGHMDPETRLLAGLPLFHVNAILVTVLSTLVNGSSAVWPGPLGYREPALYAVFWKLIEKYRPTGMSAVPTVYARLASIPVDADISSLTYPVVGAAALPPAVAEAFRARTGLDLCEGYGLTEATCATSATAPGTAQRGSVGRRLPYQQVVAANVGDDGHMQVLRPGEVGELLIKGPSVFAGYLHRTREGRQLTIADHVVDGWLRTGDLGSIDSDHRVRLAGRSKDLIIRGGHNIDPGVIEDALLAHPAVTEVGAVGMPDRHAGEVPVAFVATGESSVTNDELVAWGAEHIDEPAARPRRVVKVDSIPLTEVGKPFKPALREHAALLLVVEELRAAGQDSVRVDVTHRAGRLTVRLTGSTPDLASARDLLSGYPFDLEENSDD